MVGKPISNDPTTGTDLDQHGKHEVPQAIEPFNPAEPLSDGEMQQLQRKAEDEVRLQGMMKCVLLVLDNSVCKAMTCDAIGRNLACSTPAIRRAVQRLLDDGVCTVTPRHPQFVSKVGQ